MTNDRPESAEAIDHAVAEKLQRSSALAGEAHRLTASTRNTHGEFDAHAGTLAAAQVYALLAVAGAVHHVACHLDGAGGGAR